MNHDTFGSIEIEDVLTKMLGYCQEKTKSSAIHWISAHGLSRVRGVSENNWHWAFGAASVVGHHMWSQPVSDLRALFQMWQQVDQLFPQPWGTEVPPHMLISPHPRFIYPIFYNKTCLGILAFDRPRETNPVALIAQFREGVEIASKYLAFSYIHLEAKSQTYIDELTGLHNQRYMPIALNHEVQRAKRDKTKFSLLFMDVDYFKMVNDRRGHNVGSALLGQIGATLKQLVRACDYTFRYGGDEFIVVLGGADVDSAQVVAERIRKQIEDKDFTVEGHELKLTVSIGIATYPDHAKTADALIQLSDQAMYYGKRKCRNVVFVAS